MAKPDPALLDPSRYPFHCAVATRFGDLDTNLHVNNAALASMVEDARVRFHHACDHARLLGGGSSMVVSLALDYLAQSYYPDPLDFYVGFAAIGRTSYGVNQLMRQNGVTIAFARTVIVHVRDDRPAALPETFAQEAAAWMIRP